MAFPVRQVKGRWEVQLPPDKWLPCESKEDAELIAAAPVLEYESLEKTRSGVAFADKLENTARALEKYNIGFGSRFFQRSADEVRSAARRSC